ncbi:hypothetical protein G7Y89_g10621 [Cudoniella acicularis]|uniref:Signal recognition particle subunit SRP14 n=1 Tax=Cudoniella acicularis TaxID=354080 RepID=A0A8H4REQ7_9HELO|nr:hypothetical protein G7Y89_g10621 [Cudoniella acicularis]
MTQLFPPTQLHISDVPTVTYGEDTDVEATDSAPSQPFLDLNPSKPIPIIIRATNGKSKENRAKKVKLSTIVEAEELEGFFAKYADICKLKMSALKKRDRSKAKERLKAKKKKGGAASTGTGAAEVKKA